MQAAEDFAGEMVGERLAATWEETAKQEPVGRLVNRVVLGLLGGMVALASVGLLAVPGGPQLTRATSLLDLFGYMGLFLATVLILRVVLAALREGST